MITKIFSLLLLMLFSTQTLTAASPQSDYDYQLTQYRKHNIEFKALKEGNEKNPTLDNQQKALQAAKQAIISRDTVKITYIELLLESIRNQQLTQDYIKQTEVELINTQSFYQTQIGLAKDIVTTEDLTNFTVNYMEAQIPYQNQIIKAQAIRKLAMLIRLQTNAKNAYDNLIPKIVDKKQNPVVAGINKVQQLADEINQKISINISTIKDSEVTNSSKSNFYKKQTESFDQIKSLQLELVNILIDLEKNYVK